MDKTILINIAVEDVLSEIVLKAILLQSNKTFLVGNCLGRKGSGYLKKKIAAFNQAARVLPFIILTDLDQIDCPPTLLGLWFRF